MDFVLKGLEEKLKNNIILLQQTQTRACDVRIVSNIDVIPDGVEWPYILIKDGGIEEKDMFSYQKEELLTAKIYVCERNYQTTEAPQLIDRNSGAIVIAKKIKELLEQDWFYQFALVGYYLGTVPIQMDKISMSAESEAFTPKGSPGGKTDRITARVRIDARYYRYTTREAIA